MPSDQPNLPTLYHGGPMAPNTLADLYVEELKDLYSAEQQILKALPKMIKAAQHDELKHAFETHRLQTETHVERLEQVLEALGASPKGKRCRGMEGVIEEGDELIKEDPEPSVLDAGLISKAQHVEHYEMAGYGSVCTWATLLGHDEQASLLRQTLEEEKETDALLSDLAMQSINLDAEVERADDQEVADLPRSRASARRERGEIDRRPSPEQR
jgi:ferritin-like metal-binding protein YciE